MMKSTTHAAKIVIWAVLLLLLSSLTTTTNGFAFQEGSVVVTQSRGCHSKSLLFPLQSSPLMATNHPNDGDGTVSRRAVITTTLPAGLAALLTLTSPMPSNADDAIATGTATALKPTMEGGETTASAASSGIFATQSARVAVWPGIEGLEPMYELKLSIDAVVTGIQDVSSWPYIQRRLEKFFSGFVVNEKNFYFGVGLQYMNEIQYDKNELPNYVLLDKQTRYNALDSTMKYLENLKNTLAISGSDPVVVENLAKSAQYSLASWFALIPETDVKAVEELFQNVKKADVNRDGRLSNDEIVFLSPQQQELWKRRVDKFG